MGELAQEQELGAVPFICVRAEEVWLWEVTFLQEFTQVWFQKSWKVSSSSKLSHQPVRMRTLYFVLL